MRMRKRRILPATWPSTSWPLSSCTRNIAFGSASSTSPSNSTFSSLGIGRNVPGRQGGKRVFGGPAYGGGAVPPAGGTGVCVGRGAGGGGPRGVRRGGGRGGPGGRGRPRPLGGGRPLRAAVGGVGRVLRRALPGPLAVGPAVALLPGLQAGAAVVGVRVAARVDLV